MLSGSSALLQAWRHTSRHPGTLLVLPDGCIDLIGVQAPGQAPRWKLSPLMDTAQRVESAAGLRFTGYRFRPGAQIQADALLAGARCVELDDHDAVQALLDAMVSMDARLTEALTALAAERDLRRAQRQLGVTQRSLERLIGQGTARTPVYWKRLARLRHTARDLHQPTPLAQVAADHGYADQAHMNREFRHWLGLSPDQVRRQTAVLRLLTEPGYT